MLRWISILGGLLIMMGQHDRSETVWRVPAKSAMHQRSIPLFCHPHA